MRKLIWNTALAALAVAFGAFIAAMQVSDDPTSSDAWKAAGLAAVYAIARFLVGLVLQRTEALPTIPVDE